MLGAHHDQGGQAFQLSRLLTPSRPVSQAWAVGQTLEDGSAPGVVAESDCVSLPGWSVCVKVCDPSELSCPLLGDEQRRGGVGAAPSVCGPEGRSAAGAPSGQCVWEVGIQLRSGGFGQLRPCSRRHLKGQE